MANEGMDNLRAFGERLTGEIDRLIASHDKLAEKETEHWDSTQSTLGEIKVELAKMTERNSTRRLFVSSFGASVPGLLALLWVIMKMMSTG